MNQCSLPPLLPYHPKGEIKTMAIAKTNMTNKIKSKGKGEITATNDRNILQNRAS